MRSDHQVRRNPAGFHGHEELGLRIIQQTRWFLCHASNALPYLSYASGTMLF
jgi:hypothetical protein